MRSIEPNRCYASNQRDLRMLVCNGAADYVYTDTYVFCSSLCVLSAKVFMCSGGGIRRNEPTQSSKTNTLL